MLLLEAVEDYLRYIKFERAVSKTTYKSYHSYLYAYHRFLVEQGLVSPLLQDFSPALVRRYYYGVAQRGLCPRSLHSVMTPLRSFGTYLLEQNLLTENPAHVVKLPPKGLARRQEASEQECAALLEAVEKQRNRNRVALQRAVLCILIYTGLRRAEVCDLLVSDIDLPNRALLVRAGKGGKGRKIPICDPLHAALTEWLLVRPVAAPHPFLLCVGIRRRLYFEGLRSVVEEVKALAGFSDRTHISPHAMRHACASRLMRQGASLHEVMTWLGHTQVSTTQRYLHTSEEQLQQIRHLVEMQSVTHPGEISRTQKPIVGERQVGKRFRTSLR